MPHINTHARILVVDDFEPWRRQVRSMLETRPELEVIAEVGDGLEAVQKAHELKPDLILLDIGLPKLNGLEAVDRIRQVAPDAAIIFLSLSNDPAVAREAMSAGAQGYVVKTDAGNELFAAVASVLGGDGFMSRGIETSISGQNEAA